MPPVIRLDWPAVAAETDASICGMQALTAPEAETEIFLRFGEGTADISSQRRLRWPPISPQNLPAETTQLPPPRKSYQSSSALFPAFDVPIQSRTTPARLWRRGIALSRWLRVVLLTAWFGCKRGGRRRVRWAVGEQRRDSMIGCECHVTCCKLRWTYEWYLVLYSRQMIEYREYRTIN